MRKTRFALFQSMIALLLCFSMLVGTTFAWFTDGVSSGTNTIAAGVLDVEMEYLDAAGTWQKVTEATEVLDKNALWEPGYTEVAYLKVSNLGNLALKYGLGVQINGERGSINAAGESFLLSDHIRFGVIASETQQTYADRMQARNALTDVKFIKEGTGSSGVLYPQNSGENQPSETYITMVVFMPEEVGNAANYATGQQPPEIQLGIQLVATQAEYEADAFGTDYDAAADLPGFNFPENTFGGSVSADVKNENNQVAENVTIQGSNTNAVIPAGVQLEDGAEKLTLEVSTLDNSEANISLGKNDEMRSLDVHVEGVAENNTVPMQICLKEAAAKGLNAGNLKVYHVENGTTVEMTQVDEFTAHNQFKYDPATGDIILYMATFSEVAVVADTTAPWEGEVDHSWYIDKQSPYTIANADQLWSFSQIVGGMASDIAQDSFNDKTVKLVSDINLDDAEDSNKSFIFYPIGYYNSEYTYEKSGTAITSGFKTFEGVFDGQGHSISNFYQNTWEMKGDNEYYAAADQNYRDGMGLFGKVYGGTVQNLTVKNFKSDGEYTTTGVIAAYADSKTDKSAKFENIAIIDCNPRVYNIGNGGIVGCGGWYSKDTSTTKPLIFKNITVDKTNKISALWGSYDVACGGIMGQYYPDSGCGVSFENCNMAAQMDVYNDVCGNYQYYAYRYAGMMIGSIRNNRTDEETGNVYPDMTGITATNCTVNYGDWNDYYYCEFVENGHPSYSGENDYKFSRVPNNQIDITNGKENATCIGHDHDGVIEDNQAVYLPFSQLFTGYGWGVTSMGIKDFEGIDNITITESEQNESVVKFETKFTGDFLYRVGNANTVSVGSLFAAKDGATINGSGVYVKIDKMYEDADVSCTFTVNEKDWTKSTLKFAGTGVVDISIQDYDYCTPTTLKLEVVNAENTTSVKSATEKSVVLLNDVTGSFTVYNGHTLYGNGFTVTLPTTSQSNYSSGYVGYVTMNDGNLDNVVINGPSYPEMNIYREQAKDSSDETKANYFYNSVYINGGNCTISNAYVSGSRTAICIRGANNVTIDNTTISGGAVANVEIAGASSVTLRDVTTVQTSANAVQGMGVYVTSGVCKIYIEGELNQRNWINEDQWDKLVGTYSKFFPDFFGDTKYSAYQKNINLVTYVNLAMIFACNWDKSYLDTSKQENAGEYTATDGVEMQGYVGGVYSVTGSNPTEDDLKEPNYEAGGFSPVIPTFDFDNSANNDDDDESDATDPYCVYEKNSGTLKIGVTGDSKTIDLSGVSITKDGVKLVHTAYLNGNLISGNSVTINVTDGTKQELTFKATSDSGYDKDGNIITGDIEYTWTVTVEMAVLAYPAPVWNMGGDYQFDTSNCYYAYYSTSQGYGEAVPIYEGIKVNYYDKTGTLVNLDLSGTTTHPTGSANSNSNAFTYTLADGSTLTMKFSSGWKSGATTHQFTSYENKVYIYPQSLDNDNYVRAKTTNQDFDVKISYTFTDPNGQSTGAQTMQWYNAKASNDSVKTVQWETFDSTNGKSPECITAGTLMTMADGTQKPVENLKVGDMLLVFNHITGEMEAAPLIFNTHSGEEYDYYDVLNLQFSNGTEVEVVQSHGFFDMTLMKYVYINYDNYKDFIGHRFYGNGEKITLTKAFIEEEYTAIYCPVTYFHMNSFANGMLNTPNIPGGITGLVNYFEYDPDLKYNEEAMQRDIEKYGLYTYADFSDYISEAAYNSSPAVHLKVAVGKGMITFEQILDVIEYLLAGSLID